MLSELRSVLVVAPHADDEAMGCAGLLAKLAATGAEIRILYLAVDGFHHYGLEGTTSYPQRVAEIERVVELFGPKCSYEIAYGDMDLIEKLDTLPQRELVDRFERALNETRPDLLLLPSGHDYDQDHRAAFTAAHAAARPIAPQFGKWLVPHVLAYEMAKIQWSAGGLPPSAAICDITDVLETKLEAIKRYETQLRPAPHIRSLEAVKGLAAIRGAEIGVSYGEAFEVLRTVVGDIRRNA